MSKAVKAAIKKAKDWYRKSDLFTEPEPMEVNFPEAVIRIGTIVAIEYASDKFTGKEEVYRHEVTRERDLYVSTDGTCFLVLPGFKITTRGIEG